MSDLLRQVVSAGTRAEKRAQEAAAAMRRILYHLEQGARKARDGRTRPEAVLHAVRTELLPLLARLLGELPELATACGRADIMQPFVCEAEVQRRAERGDDDDDDITTQ